MQWTKQQAEAINARNANYLISAAAGSGKTAVVTQRAIDLIVKEEVDISRILMLTFTDLAAAEMRSRLSSKLLQEIGKGNDVKRLSEQLEKINDSDISTIHAYCISILRRHYHATNIDPNFTVLGDEAAEYKSRAMEETLEDAFKQGDKSFLQLCDAIGGRGGENLHGIVQELYSFARSQPDYIDLLNEWTNNFSLDASKIYESSWAKSLWAQFEYNVKDAITLLENAKEFCNMDNGPLGYLPTIDVDLAYFNELLQILNSKDIDKLKDIILSHKFPTLRGKKKTDDAILSEASKNLRNRAKKYNNNFQTSTLFLPSEELINRHKKMYPLMSALRDLVLDFEMKYSKIKARRGQLDFSDLQHHALNVLKNEAVVEIEKERFDYIFVDEYQDTNKLQESLINKVVSKNNLYCVGDVKQSIYAFRQADPDLFIKRRNMSSNDEDTSNKLICLNQNFRSSPAVINCLNLVFETVMSERLGSIEYTDDEKLYHGAPRPKNDDGGSVDLVMIDESTLDEKNANSSIEREAAVAAKYIKKFMGEKVWDGKMGKMRPVRFDDICILSKTFKPCVRDVRRVLEQQGIPLLPQEAGEYFDEIEVKQTLDILTVIDNRRRDISLISAMASPAFGFEMDELIKLRKSFRDEKITFFECLIKYSKLEDALSIKINEFLEKLKYYNDLSRYIPLKNFIWQVLDETGLYNAVGALPGGQVRQANLRILLDRAYSYSKYPAATLSGFLSFMKRLEKSDASISADNAGVDNAVKFMSIHKSKGLEFPIVIVINANKQANTQGSKKTLVFYKDLGFATKYYNTQERITKKTLSYEAVTNAINQSVYSEDMRVFYVALTRAREKLVVIGSLKKQTSLETMYDKWAASFLPSEYMGRSGTLLNYMASGAMRNLFCNNLRSKANIPPASKASIDNFKVDIIPASSISINRTRRAGAVAEAMKKCSEIDRKFNFLEIPHSDAEIIPTKTSATAMIKGKAPGTIIVPDVTPEPNFDDVRNFSASEKGTITHTVLEHIDLNCSDIDEFIDNLLKRGIIPDGAKSALHYEWIKDFLNSDIIKRAKKSNDLRKEIPFVLKMSAKDIYPLANSKDEVLVQGIIDMCFLEDDEWVIVDYKTNKVSESNTPQTILEHYTPQLEVYKRAVEMITKRKVKQAGLYLLSSSKIVWL